MRLLSSVLVFLYLWCDVEARCAMRAVCTEINGFPKNCPFDEDPPNVFDGLSPEQRDEIRAIIINRCPDLILDENGNQKPDDEVLTCCDHEQLRGMSESMLLSDGVLGRCPTCARNFARQICEMNCAPDQGRFLDVYTDTTAEGIEYVNEIDYRMHESFMLDAHTSCAGVIVPQTGLPAINLMCGEAAVCDAEAWFGFTGDFASNPLAPVQVNFLRWTAEEESMHVRAVPCNETSYEDLPCSCIDCMLTCPVGTEPISEEMCTVLGINCYGFAVAIFIIVLTLVALAFLSRKDYKKTTKEAKHKRQESVDNGSKINATTKLLQITFSKMGAFSASNPLLVLIVTSWLLFAMIFGALSINLTTNPLEIWSAPDSRSRAELNYYNSRFGPFYRVAQVFLRFNGLTPFTSNNQTFGPAYRIEALEELVKLEDAILNIGRDDNSVTLEQVCYAPLRLPGTEMLLDQCVSMSASTYLGDNRNNINNNTYLTQIQNCLNNFLSFGCMASWGGGAEPEITFGGYDDDILSADTLLINYPISNHLLEQDLMPVMEWEQKFLDLVHDYEANWKSDFVEVAYGAERSTEDEIARVSALEAIPLVVSYILMFVYVTFALGNIRSWKTCFIDSKIIVAISSILVVLMSIICALGVMGYSGITLTLLAINVVPFFVLSVGIDNVFLMLNTLDDLKHRLKEFGDYNENMSFNKKRSFLFEKMLGKVAPSMFVSSVTQITCFAIGSLANIPAVVTFAIFVSVALAFLFVFQITTVVAILSIDFKRTYQNRYDVFCCIQSQKPDRNSLSSGKPYQSVITKLMVPYSRFLLTWWVKILVALTFVAMLSASIMLIPRVEVGLDQEMALPPDSYVYKYLQAVNDLMKIGPPVFFVLKAGLNFSDPYHQNVICGSQLCNDDSLTTQIFLASQYANITYISRSSNSWLDDFFDWSSLQGACCKYNTTDGSFCRSVDTSPDCAYCDISRGDWQNGLRPSEEAFQNYIPLFLLDDPTDICNKGGLASYFGSVNYVLDSEGRATVGDTSFMAYHSSLATSKDYITSLQYGYEVSENITAAIHQHTGLDVEVFPYSVFYVFFEQYLTMWADTFASIGYCLIGATVLNLLASGFNFLTTIAVMSTTIMVVINMMGVMYIWNIPLNAVSCINLIVSIGIAVEFCSHIAYAFTTSSCPKEERMTDALKSVGSTMITGITFTNIPIIVLAFSYTEMIEVFFFRMLFSLVILGLLHGMVFLPVFLSYLSSIKSSCCGSKKK